MRRDVNGAVGRRRRPVLHRGGGVLGVFALGFWGRKVEMGKIEREPVRFAHGVVPVR